MNNEKLAVQLLEALADRIRHMENMERQQIVASTLKAEAFLLARLEAERARDELTKHLEKEEQTQQTK